MKTRDIPLDYIMQDEYEIDENKVYKEEDLKLGMRVHTGQLANIYNKFMLLANPIGIELPDRSSEICGVLVYIADSNKLDLNEMSDVRKKYTVNNKLPTAVEYFNDSEDNIIYPEEWKK